MTLGMFVLNLACLMTCCFVYDIDESFPYRDWFALCIESELSIDRRLRLGPPSLSTQNISHGRWATALGTK